MSMKNIYKETASYFDGLVNEFGSSPSGVGWNSKKAQRIRFDQLLKVLDTAVSDFSLNELGCGYGFLSEYLEYFFSDFKYFGYDISRLMINSAIKKYGNNLNCNFFKINNSSEMHLNDYTIASGIFNVKFDFQINDWENYIAETLHNMDKSSKKGFSFNMLTSYSDKEMMKNDLYYGDPCFFFDYCKKKFSKEVSLLHDYNLYDFTIIVRK